MKYREIIEGRFINRPNRFIAHVLINGAEETVHVKNTGRCRELLLPDAMSDWRYQIIPIARQSMIWLLYIRRTLAGSI